MGFAHLSKAYVKRGEVHQLRRANTTASPLIVQCNVTPDSNLLHTRQRRTLYTFGGNMTSRDFQRQFANTGDNNHPTEPEINASNRTLQQRTAWMVHGFSAARHTVRRDESTLIAIKPLRALSPKNNIAENVPHTSGEMCSYGAFFFDTPTVRPFRPVVFVCCPRTRNPQ